MQVQGKGVSRQTVRIKISREEDKKEIEALKKEKKAM